MLASKGKKMVTPKLKTFGQQTIHQESEELPIKWEKMLANDNLKKEIRVYTELIQLNNKRQITQLINGPRI